MSKPKIHWSQSASPRFEESILFIHHYGGNAQSTRRHQEFLNRIGYHCASITLSFNQWKEWQLKVPISKDRSLGLWRIWADEIEDTLDNIPGNKIIFSFSSPSSSVALALGRRQQKDVKAWICDGGPFFNMWSCLWNYFTHESPIKNRLIRAGVTTSALQFFMGLKFEDDFKKSLRKLPAGFPILSIRAWQDKLVPMKAIEAAFENQEHLHLETLALPEAEHLQGLKMFPEIYEPRVENFLSKYSRPK